MFLSFWKNIKLLNFHRIKLFFLAKLTNKVSTKKQLIITEHFLFENVKTRYQNSFNIISKIRNILKITL